MKRKRLISGIIIVAAVFTTARFRWLKHMAAPKLAALQLGELHLAQGNRAEALTCFFTAHHSNRNAEIRTRCLKAAQEAATEAELVDLIDLDGELIDWWASEDKSRFLAISAKGAVMYDLANATELGRQIFSADLEVYTVASNPGIPQWFAAALKDERIQIFTVAESGSCDLAREMEVRTLMGMRALGDTEHQRLAILDNGIQLLNPAADFATEFTISGEPTTSGLSNDGILFAYAADRGVRIRNLQTLLEDELTMERTHLRLLAFFDDASKLLIVSRNRVDIVDTKSIKIIKTMNYDSRVPWMAIESWIAPEGNQVAVRSRNHVEFWNLETNEYTDSTGPNPAFAWAMIQSGASVNEIKNSDERAGEANFYSESELIEFDTSFAFAQTSQAGFRLYEIPKAKLAAGVPKTDVTCFDWAPQLEELWMLSKRGTLTQQPILSRRNRWDLGRAKTLELPVSNVKKLHVLDSGRFMVNRRESARIEIWRTSAARVITHPDNYYHVIHPDGRYAIKGDPGKTPTCVIDLEEGRVVRTFDSIYRDHCGLSSDGRFCLTQHRSEAFEGIEVRVVDTISGEILASKIVERTSQSASRRGINQGEPNGRLVFTGFAEGKWVNYVWDPDTNTITGLGRAEHKPFLVAGGKGLLSTPSSMGEPFAYFWDLQDLGNPASSATIEPVPIPNPQTFKRMVAAVNRDYLYLGADKGVVNIWNPVTGEAVAVRSIGDHPEIKTADLHEVFVLPQNKGVLTAADIDECHFWDMEMTTLRWQRNDPDWDYYNPIFSDDGKLIFTTSGGRSPRCRVISTDTGDVVAEIQSGLFFRDASFRQNTHQIAILTFFSIIIWDIDENTFRSIPCEERDGSMVYFDGEKIVTFGPSSLKIFPAVAESFTLKTLNLAQKTGYHFVGGELKPMTREEWKKSLPGTENPSRAEVGSAN